MSSIPIADAEGGYSDSMFVTVPDEKSALRCHICLDVMRDSVRCPEDPVFCRCCLTRALQSTPRCPVCRVAMQVTDMLPNRILNNMILELRVHCALMDSVSEGTETDATTPATKKQRGNTGESLSVTPSVQQCEWTGPLGARERHSEVCEHVLMECRFCQQKVSRVNVARHETEDCRHRYIKCALCHMNIQSFQHSLHLKRFCKMRLVQCSLCSETYVHKERSNHINNACTARVISCPYADISGCQYQCARGRMAVHTLDANSHVSGLLDYVVKLKASHEETVLELEQQKCLSLISDLKYELRNQSSGFQSNVSGILMRVMKLIDLSAATSARKQMVEENICFLFENGDIFKYLGDIMEKFESMKQVRASLDVIGCMYDMGVSRQARFDYNDLLQPLRVMNFFAIFIQIDTALETDNYTNILDSLQLSAFVANGKIMHLISEYVSHLTLHTDIQDQMMHRFAFNTIPHLLQQFAGHALMMPHVSDMIVAFFLYAKEELYRCVELELIESCFLTIASIIRIHRRNSAVIHPLITTLLVDLHDNRDMLFCYGDVLTMFQFEERSYRDGEEYFDHNSHANNQLQEGLQQGPFLKQLFLTWKYHEEVSVDVEGAVGQQAKEISALTERLIDVIIASDSSWNEHYVRVEEQYNVGLRTESVPAAPQAGANS